MRVTAVIDVAAPAVRDVRVQLGRAEIGVAEHLLDAAQVGSAFEQVRGERMPQQVRVDALRVEARTAGEAAQDQKSARAGEGATLCVQEELRAVPLVEIGAPVREVAAERLDRVAPDRNDALLVALAGATNESLLEVDAGSVETDGFAHAEPRAVEQLDQGPVAHHAGGRAGSRLDQPLSLRRRERARELAPPARKLERGGRAVGARAEQDEVLEERAHGGNAPRDRGGRESYRAQFRQPAL